MIRELNINVCGNFSNIKTKDEYRFLEKFYDKNGILNIETKKRKSGNIKFTQNVTLCSADFLIDTVKDINKNGRFLGNVKEVENGFIPCSSVNNYYYKRVYKTFEAAKNALISKKYKETEKRCFGYLAQNKFYYSKNNLEGKNLEQMAQLIDQFTQNARIGIKIVKKFLRADIIDYYGQGGYKTSAKIIN